MDVKSVQPSNPLENHLKIVTLYHYFVFFVLYLVKWPLFWHILNLIFLSPPMVFYCGREANVTKNFCPCTEDTIWDRSVFQETMQTKFNVRCESEWLVKFSQSMAFAGALFGSFTFGFLADKFGRVNMFSLTCLFIGVAGSLVSVMPTAAAFTCMRFIEGFGVGGAIVTSYVFVIEYCDTKHREIVTALYHIPLNLGHMSLAGVSYLLRDFDDFQLTISVPMIVFCFSKFVLMESPKWLLDNNKVDKAAAVLEKTTGNRETTFEDLKKEIEDYLNSQPKEAHKKVKFYEIFKHRRPTINFFCMSVNYFICGMGYYGVSQFIGQMSGNIHLNVFLSGTLLLPGTFLCVFLLSRIPRRFFLMITDVFAGIFMLAVVCVPYTLNWLRVVFACISNCFFFVAFIVAMLYVVELFPTSVRSSVVGVIAVLARVAQILNPALNALPEFATGVIYGVSAIIGGLLCFLLPETMNIELPSSLEDSEALPTLRRSVDKKTDAGTSVVKNK